VRAVVLVGGEGTRLRPLTLTQPKQMLPVAGRPMIEHVVSHLGQHGITEVVLSLGYRPDAFLSAYPDDICAGVAMTYAVEPSPLDTAGAIAFAARLAGIDSTFVVVNGDVLTDLDVGALIAFHRARQAEATVALTPVEDPSAFGVVATDDDGRVTAFIEKPPREEAPTNLINAGTYVLEPGFLDRVPAGRRVSIERETFPVLVEQGLLYAMASTGAWVDSGTPQKYLEANLAQAARLWGPASALIDPTATVAPTALVAGSVLGAAVNIEAEAIVTDSVILAGTKVGSGAKVRQSIIGRNVNIGAGATVEELSVVGDNVTVEAGRVLSGARLGEGQ